MDTLCFRCGAEALPTTLVCMEHLAVADVEAYAAEYAVASILYYQHDTAFMSDHRYDGLCWALKQAKAWTVVSWLDEGMLTAGSGFDLSRFPEKLHALASVLAHGRVPSTPDSRFANSESAAETQA